MKFLIVEDDRTSSELLKWHLSEYGECHQAINGMMAVEAFRSSLEEDEPFDAIFLDIMMPEMNGHQALQAIREIEENAGIEREEATKVVMTTSLGDTHNTMAAFVGHCDGYLVKPIVTEVLHIELVRLGFSRTTV